ncbi:cohesin subunit SA-3 [Ambystoma mexicanum]|uniref:cohesin subunit SA-3 n=1 Tax=Ambystoma mexicanum TaxID=8296 RepID=UPI0037E7C4BD
MMVRRSTRLLDCSSSQSSSGPTMAMSPRALPRHGFLGSSSGTSSPSVYMAEEMESLIGSDAPSIQYMGRESEFQSDTGSDFEETLRKTAKRVARTPPRNVQVSKRQRPADAKVVKRKAPPKSVPTSRAEGTSQPSNIFEAVKTSKSAMQSVVDDWLEDYKQDKEAGLLDLINFILQACGCKGVLTQEMLQKLQNAEIIHMMTEKFDEESADYPLSMTSLPWKKFKANFCEFIHTLVRQCQYNIIYDEFLMDTLISMLTGLSDSQVRAFRHTSTLAALKLMSALVNVALNLTLHKDNNQRQYEAERNKALDKRATERLEALLVKRKELQENQEEIENMMNAVFKGVFVHRYRDAIPEIRAVCMEEMGVWMKNYSYSFLNDGYLKYIGWTLNDKQGYVRLTCLKTLQALYCNKEMSGKLELFTSRFKDRMVSMVLDKEDGVSVAAIQLLTLIQQNMEDLLSSEDCENVYPLVFASNRAIASAAGEFLYKKLFLPEVEAAAKNKGRRGVSGSFFLLLVAFFIESEYHEHAAYLVDSLWDSAAPLLKDWEGLTALLLEESSEEEEELNDKEEGALIEILASSIRQAVEGQPPVGRVSRKKIVTMKEKKAQADEKVKLTQHLILVLPQLLAKFSPDTEKVAVLLRLPHFLELEIYCTSRLEKYLELLLKQIQEIVEKHTDNEVLEASARALYILCNEELAIYNRVNIALSQLLDRLVDKFQQEVEEIMQTSELDEDEIYNMAATMKRISVFHNAHNMTRWELFDPCCQLLKKGIDTGEIPKQIMVPALTCAHFFILWELCQASTTLPKKEQLSTLKQRLCSFSQLCENCLSDVDPVVREQAFILLSDLLLMFSHQMTKSGQDFLQSLVYKPDASLQTELAGFLLDNVFIDLESEDTGDDDEALKIEILHKRRNLLAGYCKLIIYNVLDLNSATDVFKHYVKYYNDYGDIIKETLSRARLIDKVQCARTLLLTLQQAFSEMVEEQGTNTPAIMDIRDLARRFAMMFGPDQLRNREPIVMLHKDGIKFAFQDPPAGADLTPQNLAFLDILCEFSFKLLKQDKKALLQYLEKTCESLVATEQQDESWNPLMAYRRSLSTEEETLAVASGIISKGSTMPLKRGPVPSAKRRRIDMLNSSVDSSWLRTTDSLQLGGRLKTPQHTSTVLKEKAKSGRRQEGLLGEDDDDEEEEEEADISDRGSESDFAESQSWLGTQRLREMPTPASHGQPLSQLARISRQLRLRPQLRAPATPASESRHYLGEPQHQVSGIPASQQGSQRMAPSSPANDSGLRLLGPHRRAHGTPTTVSREILSGGIHRLSLMEEDEEDDELVIRDDGTSKESESHSDTDISVSRTKHLLEERLPDLLDSAILDSEDDDF